MMTQPDLDKLAKSLTAAQRDNFCNCPLHTLFPMRESELIEPTLDDLKAACTLIGKDTYGKPHWTPETLSPCNPVVQAFACHARLALRNHLKQQEGADGR